MKILIIGASGYLGSEVHSILKNTGATVYGTCYQSTAPDLIQVNMQTLGDHHALIDLNPDVIIWSIYDFEAEMNLSTIGLKSLIDNIPKHVRLIYVSTMLAKGVNQTEETTPCPRTSDEYLYHYVNGKIKGEQIVSSHPNHVIVRPGSIYGFGLNRNPDSRMKGLILKSKSSPESPYTRTANLYTSFVHVNDLAHAIVELSTNQLTGIINISGDQPISYYHFNLHLANLLDLDSSFIAADYNEETQYHTLENIKRKQYLKTIVREIVI